MLSKITQFVFDGKTKGTLAYRFRQKRMLEFENFYRNKVLSANPNRTIQILDIGGEDAFWRVLEFKYIDSAHITLLNLKKMSVDGMGDFSSVIGDATDLSEYGDQSFDVFFSNSVIEHVGDFAAQTRMAKEMRRVGKHCYLQTPNRNFPIEPHFHIPFIQFLPLKLRALICLPSMPHKTMADALRRVSSVRLLSRKELEILFPGSNIQKEKIGFLTKSFYLFM